MDIVSNEKILKTMSLLYVEKDDVFRLNVVKALKLKAKKVFDCSTIKEASIAYNSNNIDLIITNISFDKTNDGIKFIHNIRQINKKIPIIVISESKNLLEIVELIKYNLIDYIFKPIDIKQLREGLSRAVEQIIYSGNYITYFKNNIEYNMQKNILTSYDHEVTLTNQERLLLNFLIKNQNLMITQDEIKDVVWENSYDVSDTAFKALINRLRQKIGKETIKNSSGNGYILDI